jgi:predicted metal-dependent phosphoesterase TrpH
MLIKFTGHITPEDKARSDYYYVPFDLPVPARSLRVHYRYSDRITADKIEGGNVIDIGLFDPQGADFPGGAGFRGWSGSDRAEFSITTRNATPGYLPGPLPAGRYQVIFGLYRIWPRGADFELQIEAEPENGIQSSTLPLTETPTQAVMGKEGPSHYDNPFLWLQGDLQTHTDHSDGKGSPQVLVSKARGLGLDYLAITDHNTISSHALFPSLAADGLVLIPGQEVTTYYGHMNIWGTSRWCDFRCRSETEIAAVIDLAHQSGGLCSINHPRSGDLAWNYNTDLSVDGFEVWNGPWPNHNIENLALWDALLKNGRRLPVTGGSDYHCPSGEDTGFVRLGQPTTWVKSTARSAEAVLEAIQSGRACVCANPGGPRLDIEAATSSASAGMGGVLPVSAGETVHVRVEATGGEGFSLKIISEAGVIHEAMINSSPMVVEMDAEASLYLRAELVGDFPPEKLPANTPAGLDLRQWRFAISNPVYLRIA